MGYNLSRAVGLRAPSSNNKRGYSLPSPKGRGWGWGCWGGAYTLFAPEVTISVGRQALFFQFFYILGLSSVYC